MNDLDRIKEIERIFGFPLHRVERLEDLGTEKGFFVGDESSKGTRNYCLNKQGEAIGLSLDYCPVFLLPTDLVASFASLKSLSLKNSRLSDYSFLRKMNNLFFLDLSYNNITYPIPLLELIHLEFLDLSYNGLADASFLGNLMNLRSLNLHCNSIRDLRFLQDLSNLQSLDLSVNNISNTSFLNKPINLTTLNISENDISDLSFLKNLIRLESLDLSFNPVSESKHINELLPLTVLNISYCEFKNYNFLGRLKSLKSLNLLGIESFETDVFEDLKELNSLIISLSDISFLKKIESLSFLDINGSEEADFYHLKDLKNLKFLILSGNQISEAEFLKNLTELISLNLSENLLTDISFLKDLKGLNSLNLRNNKIKDFSIIGEIKGLISLNVSQNSLSDMSFLKELRGLEFLDISYNKIKDLNSTKELTGLTTLNLSDNHLSDIISLKDFKNIISLDLSKNAIKDFNIIKEFKELTSLNLSHNQLSDVSFLKALNALTFLDISSNNLKQASFLEEMKGLTYLQLSGNRLSDVSFLRKMKGLTYVDLSNNHIENIQSWFLDLDLEISMGNSIAANHIVLAGNPIVRPPFYLLKRGKKAVKEFFQKGEPYLSSFSIKNYFSLEDIEIAGLSDKKEIYFLGENGDGKTTLLQGIALSLKGIEDFGSVNSNLKDNYNILSINYELSEEQYHGDMKKEYDNDDPLVLFSSEDSFGHSNKFGDETTSESYPHLNVYGYGINRIFNSKRSEREDERKEVYLSLFDPSYGLIDPVEWLKGIRFEELDNKDKELPPPTVTLKIAAALFSELLNNEIEIEVSSKAVHFSEKGSSPISFRQLSDGYKSVINWLCDLLSRLTANQPYVTKLEDYYGIVLVDEIGVYLHPSLQYSLVQMLRSKFKKIQWIFTTHSPIVTLGASPDAVFYKLYKENGKTKVAGPVNGIAGMTANSLITSLLWRLNDFTTRGTSLDEISSDDYIYKVIHKTVQERIRNNPQIRENDVADMVQKLLNNIKELDSQVKKDLSLDSAIAHKILES